MLLGHGRVEVGALGTEHLATVSTTYTFMRLENMSCLPVVVIPVFQVSAAQIIISQCFVCKTKLNLGTLSL